MKAMLAIGLFACALIAQGPEPEAGLVALHQARLDLDCDLVALNVAAHPDDESSRTNTMLRRKYGVRVVTVYTTYGDGARRGDDGLRSALARHARLRVLQDERGDHRLLG